MGPIDRLSKNGDAPSGPTRSRRRCRSVCRSERASVHAACIAKLGPTSSSEDPAEFSDLRVQGRHRGADTRRTPLTRDERASSSPADRRTSSATARSSRCSPMTPSPRSCQRTRPRLHRSVGQDRARAVRFVDDAHRMRIIDKMRLADWPRIDEASPMVVPRLRTAAASTRSFHL